MFRNLEALCSPDEDESGGGASGGGSPDGDQGKKGGDEELIPVNRFKAALADQERRLREEFRAEIETIKAKPVEKAKHYTKAELNAAVEASQITREQADDLWDNQTREQARQEARQVASETISAAERARTVTDQISRYKAVAPEILDEANDTRQRIRAEFNELVSLGDDPRQLSTQLKAIRAVLGPIGTLEKARSGKASHESHRETGGGSGGSRPSKDLKDTLTEVQRKHYQKGIDSGRYKDWKEVGEELKYAKRA